MNHKTRNAYASMMVGSIAHNLARYQLGLVPFSTTVEYKSSLIEVFKEYKVNQKVYRKWMRMAEVKALKEVDIILANKDLQSVDSHGGSSVTARALVEPYLAFMGYPKETPAKQKQTIGGIS